MSASSAAAEREELQRQYAAMKARRSASQSRGQSLGRGSVSPQRTVPNAVLHRSTSHACELSVVRAWQSDTALTDGCFLGTCKHVYALHGEGQLLSTGE